MRKYSVLVVDDSKVIRFMIAGILAGTEFEICDSAENSTEAVEKYKLLQPDLVTMDMNLPDGNGIECSRQILAINPKAKIVMVSAMKDASLITQGQEAGISSFLQKPVKAQVLLETLQLLAKNGRGTPERIKEAYAKPFMKVLKKNLFALAGVNSKMSLEVNKAEFIEIDGIAVVIGLTGSPVGRAILKMDKDTMQKFSQKIVGEQIELSEDEIIDNIEEAANIIVGRGVSVINDSVKDKEMRITPPGTIYGSNIRMDNSKVLSFNITAMTDLGEFKMNVGFAEGE